MDRRRLICTFLAGAIGLGMLGWNPQAARADEGEEDDRTPIQNPHFDIHDCMSLIGKAYKRLTKQIKIQDKKENSLELLSVIQSQIILAKCEEPKLLLSASGADREKGTLEFRKLQLDLLEQTIKTELDLLDGKFDDAAKSLEAMKTIMGKGHEKFKPKEEKQ